MQSTRLVTPKGFKINFNLQLTPANKLTSIHCIPRYNQVKAVIHGICYWNGHSQASRRNQRNQQATDLNDTPKDRAKTSDLVLSQYFEKHNAGAEPAGKVVLKTVSKYHLITTHTAGRSFAISMFNGHTDNYHYVINRP